MFWNIVLFVPIGVLLMMVFSFKQKWIVSIAVSFFLSVVIEIIQLIFHRGLFEFDDMVHNTFGGAIGVALYFIVISTFKYLKGIRQV